MSVLFKATLAFLIVLAAGGQLHLETARWQAVAGELVAANPRAALARQVHHFLADIREPA